MKKVVSLIDLKVMKTRNNCEIACDCVKRANVVLHAGLCREIFARTHTATHKPTSAQPLYSYQRDIHLIIVCGAPRTYVLAGQKALRYSALLATCENNGWHATHFPAVVGSWGWVAHSLFACLQKLGFSASWRKNVRWECSRVALRCSYLLYLCRSIKTWNSFNELSPYPSAASENRDTC